MERKLTIIRKLKLFEKNDKTRIVWVCLGLLFELFENNSKMDFFNKNCKINIVLKIANCLKKKFLIA